MIRCWPVFQIVKKPAVVQHVRRARRLRRVAAAAVSKPAIIGWTCLATWWPTQLGQPALAGTQSAAPGITAASRPWEVLPCCGGFIDTLPPTEFPIIGPPVLLPDLPIVPDVPTTPPVQPTPEPSSLALLATAVALMVWRMR